MKYRLLVSIAKSLLLARWKQTLVAAIGVTFSITMFIALLGFMTGLNDLLDDLILNRTPHIRLFNEIKPNAQQPVKGFYGEKGYHHFIHSIKSEQTRTELYNTAAILKALSHDNRVLGFAPRITTQLFFNQGDVNIPGVINGINVPEESRLFAFSDYVTTGKPNDIKDLSNTIILGKGLADKLMVNIGDIVHITTPSGNPFSLKVVGFFQSGLLDFDKVQSYASIETTRKLMGVDNDYISDINIKLKQMPLAPPVAIEYAGMFHCDAEDIIKVNSQFETGTKVRTIISYAVGITLLIVSGFGIYNILNMMIYEKMDSIAILKATGFSGRDVRSIFLIIAISIGLFGGLLGLVFGFGFSLGIDQIPFNTPSLPTINTYPVNYNPKFYFIGIIFSLITTFFAGYFPSRKASKVDPVVIIRGK